MLVLYRIIASPLLDPNDARVKIYIEAPTEVAQELAEFLAHNISIKMDVSAQAVLDLDQSTFELVVFYLPKRDEETLKKLDELVDNLIMEFLQNLHVSPQKSQYANIPLKLPKKDDRR